MGKLISKAVFKSGSENLTKEVPKSFFDFKIRSIDGNVVDFGSFKGNKVFLVVNVACKWGLTSQNYKELTKLYD